MSFPAYSAYMDAGVDWLGKIPEHWQQKWLGLLAVESRTAFVDGPFGSDLKSSDYQEEGIPLIQLNNIRDGLHVLRNMKFISEEKRNELYRHSAFPGDIVIAKMADPVARSAIVSDEFSEYVIVADCVKMTPDLTSVDLSFLIWAINSDCVRISAELMSSGVTRIRINLGQIKKLRIPYPPLREQTQIARFLDYETARIDALIEEQRRLIELLKEKRQAVISHAVTKGVDSAVPMKDSGVEWLGKVPEHWVVSRVKNVASFITSGSRGWSDYIDESGEDIFLQSGDMDNRLNVLFDKAKRIITPEGAEGLRTRLQDGDLVVCITGANTGRVAVVGKVCEAAYVNQHLGLVRPYVLACNSRYLGYALSSSACQSYFNVEQYGLKEGLSLTDIAEAPLMVPPLAEQVKLVEVIENHLVNLDGLTRDSEMIVELLQERRAALISAAVTGKMDVRGWLPPARAKSSELEQEAV